MSHVDTFSKVVITDLDDLEKACKEFGMILIRDKKTYKWYGRWVNDYHADTAAYKNGINVEDYGKCSHVINLPGCEYEIGLVEVKGRNGFVLVFDHYGPGQALIAKAGQGCVDLVKAYIANRIKSQTNKLSEHGISLEKVEKTNNGNIQITLSSM